MFNLIETGDDATRFNRMSSTLVQTEFLLEHVCRGSEVMIDVAVFDLGLSHQIVGRGATRPRRTGSKALDRIDNGGSFSICNSPTCSHPQRCGGTLRNGGHRFADIADFPDREQVGLGRNATRLPGG